VTRPTDDPTRISDPGVGRLVGRRYRLVERVGGGATANVYRAIDERLDRPVAVKLLREQFLRNRRFVRRFMAEARRTAALSHPSVVPVYDVGTDRGPFLITEFVEGRDLGSVLTAGGRQSPRDAARITSDVAAGLQAAHEQGIVHGDVKPGNILVGTDGRAHVADFGIARVGSDYEMNAGGTLPGSVEYHSPEQARGEQAVPASDIYSLGIILYELLTGVRPFAGATLNALASARLHVPAPDPRGAAPDVPDELASIVGKALATDPANRYPSARAMRRDLVAWLDKQRPVAGARVAPWQVPRRAWPLAVALLALAAAGYLGGRAIASNTATAGRDPAQGPVVA
jgi:serine/threonine-protein kinase